jgi:biopolymer transport protein ExbD
VRLRGRGGRYDHLGQLPLTSLIDVVFLLLIYFIVTAQLTTGESRLTAALTSESRKAGRAADLQPQVVIVDATPDGRGIFRLGERATSDRETLVAVLRDLPKESGVFVKVMGRAPVDATAAAWQACKDAGFTRITYVPVK